MLTKEQIAKKCQEIKDDIDITLHENQYDSSINPLEVVTNKFAMKIAELELRINQLEGQIFMSHVSIGG